MEYKLNIIFNISGGNNQILVNADLSCVKCLLHKLLPKEYFDLIAQLREHQDAQVVFNIHGGHNLIAPKARQAKQNFGKK